MNNKKNSNACGNYRPVNDVINGSFFSGHEHAAVTHNCSDCVYFSPKNCGNEFLGILEESGDFY